jgi:uncharacterized repeat protein (TIGR01451 family)
MNDDRFERSADMRLMDLQRTRIGAPAPRLDWERLGGALPHASGAPVEDEPAQRGALLSATLDAQPRSGLIPGAQVTASIAIVNDGTDAVAGIRAVLPLPAGLRFAPGSLRIDAAERDDESAADLLGAGIALAPLGPGERRTVVLRFAVERGLDDVTLLPHVRADDGTGITGPRGLRLTRGPTRVLESLAAPERPFYELDDEEAALEAEAHDDAAPVFAVVQPSEHFEPVLPPPPEPPMPEPPVMEPPAMEPPVSEPAPEPEPEAEPVAVAAALAPSGPQAVGNGSFVLEVTLDRSRVASLRGLFAGKPLGMLAHYLVLNALAVRRPLAGDGDTAALTAFLEHQERLLSRALITTRLGKTIAPESVAAPLPPFPPDLPERDGSFALAPAPAGALTLVRVFRPSEVAFIARTLGNGSAHPFLRAAQFFVGLAPGDAAHDDADARARVAAALLTYATQAAASISRIFLRAKLSRSVALFRESDPELDAAGGAALACIAGLIA